MAKIVLNEVPKEVLKTFLKIEKQGLGLVIKVKPNSCVEKLYLSKAGELILNVRDVASEGAANIRVVEILADIFSLPKSKIEIVTGYTSRIKRVLLHELTLIEIVSK